MKDEISINNKGFTFVELLAVIAVLAVVITISIYTITNTINNAKEKGYQTTINNIEQEADDYITEGLSNFYWTNSYDGTYQYQCVKVQDLIDGGYLKNSILDSYVSKNRKVLNSDNIYLERDTSSKTIIKNVLILDDAYNGLCNNITVLGNIDIVVEPSRWSKSKTINILYRLSNSSIVSDYRYNYKYEPEDNINLETIFKNEKFTKVDENIPLEVNRNGKLNALIFNDKGEPLASKEVFINKIDNTNPYGSIMQNGKNIKLSLNDDHSGVAKYYFGKNNPENSAVEWTSTEISNKKEIDKTIREDGIWYLGIQDQVGNQVVVSKKLTVDTTAPQITLSIKGYVINYDNNFNIKSSSWKTYSNNWTQRVKVKISVTDDISGINDDTLKYAFSTSKDAKLVSIASWDNEVEEKAYHNQSEVLLENKNGEYYLIAEACDNAGNCTRQTSEKLKLDNKPPEITCNIKVTEVIHYKRDENGETTTEIYYKNPVIPREDTEECDAYHYMLFKRTVADYLGCDSVFDVYDKNGIATTKCAYKHYDDDGNTICKQEGETDSCIAKATACNCIHDDEGKYCKHIKIYSVLDEAGNKTTEKFTYYYQYNDPSYSNSYLRRTYCTEENLKAITESK